MNKKILVITNIPAPYREDFHFGMYKKYGDNYIVVYCAKNEPNRKWKFELQNYTKVFLSEHTSKYKHFNINILNYLIKLKPHIIIMGGFNPTNLFAWLYSKFTRIKTICWSDSNLFSENKLTWIHKKIRHFIIPRSDAFLVVSNKGRELFEYYGAKAEKIFWSPLVINNQKFQIDGIQKIYDITFSGQFIERKQPLFFLEVARSLKYLYPTIKVLLLGEGPLKSIVIDELNKNKIDYYDAGFVQQDELPYYYNSSKVLLFPTVNEPWGLVVNEACASGVPVITTPVAGVAKELIIDGDNGFLLPLEVDLWVEKTAELLSNSVKYGVFSVNCRKSVEKYNNSNAIRGAIDCINSLF